MLLAYDNCMLIFTGDNSCLEDLVTQDNRTLCEVLDVTLKAEINILTKKSWQNSPHYPC